MILTSLTQLTMETKEKAMTYKVTRQGHVSGLRAIDFFALSRLLPEIVEWLISQFLRRHDLLCCLAFRHLHGSAPPYLAGYVLHSSQLNWGTLTASIGCRRVTSRPTHLDCAPGRSRFPLRLRGIVSRPIFVIPASVFPVLGRNWKHT